MTTTNLYTAHFQLWAQYNTKANQTLYATCAELSDTERKQIRPAFFKSIHGTLNHILVSDRIWLSRFEGKNMPSTGLDTILYKDFDALWQARTAEDFRIEALTAELTIEILSKTIRYRNNQGNLHADLFSLLMAHFFNHQTHHRGQVHNLLSQTTIAPPSLDMHRLIRPNSITYQ